MTQSGTDCLRELQAFLDERWAVAGPKFYPGMEGPQVPPELSATEACYFLAAVSARDGEAPLLVVDEDRHERSDRYPRLADGRVRGYNFFESPGRLRLETLVHWAAAARLRDEFRWPREHLVLESPAITNDGLVVLKQDALDILLLEQPCAEPPAKMSLETAGTRVAVEAKAKPMMLARLLEGMRACQTDGTPHGKSDHVKCAAIAELRPRLFLGVSAGGTWRLFTVVDREGRAVLGGELPDLDRLRFE
jgi:hypothetical protein